MDAEIERALRILDESVEQAKTIRIEVDEGYRRAIALAEALPQNQSGADKSGRWRGSRRYAESLIARATLLPRNP